VRWSKAGGSHSPTSSDRHIEVIRDWIGLQLQRIRIVEADYGDVPLDILLGAGRFASAQVDDAERAAGPPDSVEAGQTTERWSYGTDRPFFGARLREMFKRRLAGSVYRCMVIVFTYDDPAQPFALQVVGRHSHMALSSPQTTWPKRSDTPGL
jgi:G3E family GTPase